MLRPVTGNQQIEGLRNAAHGREFQLGATLAEIADDAIKPRAAIVEDDGRHNPGVAARLQPLFSPTKHSGSPDYGDDVIMGPPCKKGANAMVRILGNAASRD